MVPSSSARDSSGDRSGNLSVFLATLLWSVIVFLMAWMVPERTALRLRSLPIQPWFGFWGIALLTLCFAWPVRRDIRRGSIVLTISLLSAAWFLMTLR